MVMLWLTSDWHLGEHRKDRPFSSAEENIAELVDKHNALVSPDDEVIVVGDAVNFFTPDQHVHISKFNGKKTLIRGNHDRNISDDVYYLYFDKIIKEGDGFFINCGMSCYVTHYPTQGKKDFFNLVGHVHSAWKYQLNMFNIGVDANHFRPVKASSIPDHFKAISQFYDADVWIAYDEINNSYYGKRGKNTRYFLNTA